MTLRLRAAACAVLLAIVVGTSGCFVNQNNLSPADRYQLGTVATVGSQTLNVSYGPLDTQKLDVYRPAGASVGTLIFMHPGGWVSGDRTAVDEMIKSELNRGWSLVSVEYRLSDQSTAAQIVSDVDRAIRFVKASATTLRLNVATVIATGTSAGGHLALLAGLAPGNVAVDPTLPANLKAVSPAVNAVAAFVGPTDMLTLWQAGGWAGPLQEQFLDCTLDRTRVSAALPYCSDDTVRRYSPTFWAALANFTRNDIPPVYIGYGALDTLVRRDSQGDSLYQQLIQNGRDLKMYYDIPPDGGHNLDEYINKTAFDLWLNKVKDRSF